MMKLTIIAMPLVGLLVGLVSCSSAPAFAPASRAVSERVITAGDFGTVVNARRGDVVVVRPPMNADEWQVLFDETILSISATPDERRHPGADGWRFTVVGTGDAEVTITAVFRAGGPNPPRFSVTLRCAA